MRASMNKQYFLLCQISKWEFWSVCSRRYVRHVGHANFLQAPLLSLASDMVIVNHLQRCLRLMLQRSSGDEPHHGMTSPQFGCDLMANGLKTIEFPSTITVKLLTKSPGHLTPKMATHDQVNFTALSCSNQVDGGVVGTTSFESKDGGWIKCYHNITPATTSPIVDGFVRGGGIQTTW